MREYGDIIYWDKNFLLDIQVLDKQHEKLITMTNELRPIILDAAETRVFQRQKFILEIANYLQYHFNTEERLMLLLDYGEYNIHKEKHTAFLEEIMKVGNAKTIWNQVDLLNFYNFLRNSGLHHLAIHDKAFAEFFIEQRVSGRLGKTFILDSSRTPVMA